MYVSKGLSKHLHDRFFQPAGKQVIMKMVEVWFLTGGKIFPVWRPSWLLTCVGKFLSEFVCLCVCVRTHACVCFVVTVAMWAMWDLLHDSSMSKMDLKLAKGEIQLI